MASPYPNEAIEEISVEEFAQLRANASNELQLVDVREPAELELARLDGFENLPLSAYGEWSAQIHTRLDPEKETLVMCHHGMRSAEMCQWLKSQGFTQVKNIAGGIEAYALLVDPSVPRY